ncbi:MAG TPA: hypothetical protein VMV29_12145, partial [Ktedonobacterales bacterium]|nr:hypothetical protein [Ktedonobacterales bacterium]
MSQYQTPGTIAVTDGRTTSVSDGRQWKNRQPYERASLVLAGCRTLGIAQLWLTRAALDALPDLGGWLAEARDEGWDCQPTPRGPGWWHCFQRGGVWGSVDLVVPCLDRGYHAGGRDLAWAAAQSAEDLLAGLLAYETLTGARFRRSPGATGTALLTALHARKH